MDVRLLVVEDERDMNRLIVKMLEKAGYSVDACFDGEEALACLRCADYDGILLDVTMPRLNGHEVVRRLRDQGNATPVLFLTARDSIADRVTGLDLGADDYLIKPFDVDELLARVRVLTRKAAGSRSNIYTVADLTVDVKARTATRAGVPLHLSVKEYAVLEYLIRNAGIVLSRDKIEANIWNYEYDGGSNVVDVYISYLRKKVDSGFDQKLIHTVWGAGWVLKEEKNPQEGQRS